MMWFIYLLGFIVTLTFFVRDLLKDTDYRQNHIAHNRIVAEMGIYLLVVAATFLWPVFWFLVVFMCRRAPKVRMER